jgi:hypothetical protein
MHDGAPAQFSVDVRHHLNDVYGLRWIGRGGPTAWPARSPHLNSCDYYVWGYMKAKVYRTRVENQEELLERIMVAAEEIRQNPEELARVSASLRRRVEACIRLAKMEATLNIRFDFFLFISFLLIFNL